MKPSVFLRQVERLSGFELPADNSRLDRGPTASLCRKHSEEGQWVSLNPQGLLPPLKCRQDNPSNRLNCINSASEPGHLLSCRIGEVWTEIFSSNSNTQCCENCAVATEDDEASRVKHVSYLFMFSGNAAGLIVLPVLAGPKSTSAPSGPRPDTHQAELVSQRPPSRSLDDRWPESPRVRKP
jgi:hypothetical protein